MTCRGWILTAAVVLACNSSTLSAQRWREEMERENKKLLRTETVDLPPELPASVTAESTRLIFGVAPVRTDGLLSKQVREIVKSLSGSLKQARIVRLRAFVAGSGDTRLVREVVAEFFSKRNDPLPTLSVAQVGRLPHEGAQVMFEYVAEHKKPQNPNGLAFVSGQTVTAPEPTLSVAPLAVESLGRIRTRLSELGPAPATALMVTCYCSSLMDGGEVRRAMIKAFPGTAVNLVQLRRSYTQGSVSCEAVARLKGPAVLRPRAPEVNGRAQSSPAFSELAVVGPGRVTFTGSQLAFRHQDSDIRLAFERLGRVLEESGTSLGRVVKSNIYPISLVLAAKIRAMGFEFFDKANPPASTLVEMEGLPSIDASFAVDVVASVP